MDNKVFFIIYVLIIVVASISVLWFVIPDGEQIKMVDYDNEHVETKIGFISSVKCPYGHVGNLTPIACIENHVVDDRVEGTRIKTIFIYYCNIHHIQFSLVPQ